MFHLWCGLRLGVLERGAWGCMLCMDGPGVCVLHLAAGGGVVRLQCAGEGHCRAPGLLPCAARLNASAGPHCSQGVRHALHALAGCVPQGSMHLASWRTHPATARWLLSSLDAGQTHGRVT